MALLKAPDLRIRAGALVGCRHRGRYTRYASSAQGWSRHHQWLERLGRDGRQEFVVTVPFKRVSSRAL